jgi:hypothetical protein
MRNAKSKTSLDPTLVRSPWIGCGRSQQHHHCIHSPLLWSLIRAFFSSFWFPSTASLMASKKRSADYNGNYDDDAANDTPRRLAEYRDRFYDKLEQVRVQLASVINARYGKVNPNDFTTPEGRIYWNFRLLQEMTELNRVYGGTNNNKNVFVDQYLIGMGMNDAWQCGVTAEQSEKLNVSGSKNDTLLVHVESFRNARRIAAGGESSAVLADGIPYVFGGQDVLVDQNASSYEPVPLADVKYFPDQGDTLTEEIISMADMAVGDAHMLLLTVDGQVYSTGFYKDNDSGHFIDTGDNNKYNEKAPDLTLCAFHRVTSLDLYHQKVVKIFAGECLSAAILQDGTLVTWGTFLSMAYLFPFARPELSQK